MSWTLIAFTTYADASHMLVLPGYPTRAAALEGGDALCGDWRVWRTFQVIPGPPESRSRCEWHPHRPAAGFAFFLATDKGFPMPSITAPDITTAQTLSFGLIGNTPVGDAFAEPTVVVAPPTAGTVALQPSAQGAPDPTGAVPFTTAGVFTPAAGFTGAVTLSADVAGVDDQDVTFNVVAVPAPETVAFDSSKFAAAA